MSRKSESWKQYNDNTVTGFKDLLTDESYYKHMQREIARFRNTADVPQFLNDIQTSLDILCLGTVHLFALFHHDPSYINQDEPFESKFVDERTFAMMDFLKEKYAHSDKDLSDGIPIAIEYFKLFGFQFENTPKGGYCHVLDI